MYEPGAIPWGTTLGGRLAMLIGAGAMPGLGMGGRAAAMAVGEGYEVFIGPEYRECSEPWGEFARSR